MEPYQLLMASAEGYYEEKRSRFLALAVPVRNEAEAAEAVAARRKEHSLARHHCYAYVIGPRHELTRFSDDGEPSGTAGRPILDVLLGSGLHNTLVIVTRYFGGTLLGTGGLVRAYGSAASDALAGAERALLYHGRHYRVSVSYSDYEKLSRMMDMIKLPHGEDVFSDRVSREVYLLPEQEEDFFRALAEMSNGKAETEKCEETDFFVKEDGTVKLQ